MNENIERRAGRILIALSAEVETRLSLDVYRYLLGDAPPTFVGLLVENPRLIAHARAALAREIVLSGVERRLEPESLERQLRARWSELRRWFETESARLGIAAEVTLVRDDPRQALAKAIERADALVVERDAAADALELWSSLTRPATLRALLLAPPRWPVAGDVVVLADPGALAADSETRRASEIETALRLARRTGAPLTVLATGSVDENARGRLARHARESGVRLAAVIPLRSATLDALADAARHASVLILPSGISPEIAAAVATRLRGATLLWRSTASPPEART